VVCERTSWKGGYVGINSFGIAGSNVHVLLRSPDTVSPVRTIHVAATTPRLVTCSGRTKEAVEVALAEMCRHPADTDLQYLLQNSLGDLSATTHSYRGFTLVNAAASRQTVEVCTGLMDSSSRLDQLNKDRALFFGARVFEQKFNAPTPNNVKYWQTSCRNVF